MSDGHAAVRAAQYVRMSTEKQIYSTENQMAAIASYALLRGFEIVATYADEGRSGLHLKGRKALQEMLRDVLSGEPGYDAILVFDVSRWGRFQDTDESAHYEFVCRSSGVPVHYCAEMFENDGSLASTIMKNVRRAMAGEYSRDLSAKVWGAQCRLAGKGHKMGGIAPYGMRRVLLDQDGNIKGHLQRGEWKSLRSDRVTLAPGTDEEVAIVRRIYRLSGERGLTDSRIASILNRAGIPAVTGSDWTRYAVARVLKCDAYLGANVFNRTSSKLGTAKIRNSPEEWVRCEGAFEPIITERMAEKVRASRDRNRHIYSDDDMIEKLKLLLEREGKLSAHIMNRSQITPALTTYRKRFGSMKQIFSLADYDPKRFSHFSVGRGLAHHAVRLRSDAKKAIEAKGGRFGPSAHQGIDAVDKAFTLGITAARYVRNKRGNFWRVSLKSRELVSHMLIGFMDRANARIEHICLLPSERFSACGRIAFYEAGHMVDRFRVPKLEQLYPMICEGAPNKAGLGTSLDDDARS